jgi:hypothetical protein
VRHPDVAADDGALADGDAAEHGGAGVDDHVVLQDRVPRQALGEVAVGVHREALGAQGDVLVQPHALADDGRLADDDAGAVVDEEAGADGGARVDVDAGAAVRHFGHDARQQRQAQLVQLVRQAVVDHGVHAGIAQQHLVDAARRRVALPGGHHVGVEHAADGRQGGCEVAQQAAGALLQHLGRGRRLALGMAQFQPHLHQQRLQRRADGVADVEVLGVLAQVGRAQAHREQRALEGVDAQTYEEDSLFHNPYGIWRLVPLVPPVPLER